MCKRYESVKDDKEKSEEILSSLNNKWQMIENRLLYNSFLVGNYMTYADVMLVLQIKKFEKIDQSHKYTNIKRVIKFVENTGLISQ